MKKIKAVLFDLDGTAIPNGPDGMPSKRVLDSLKRASKHVKIACATGREIAICKHIIEALPVNAPCIIAGGSQVIDEQNFEPLWERTLQADQLKNIVSRCKHFPYWMMNDGDPEPYSLIANYTDFVNKPIIFIVNIPKINSIELIEILQNISDINVHAVTGWTQGKVDIHITHKEASKKHAMKVWLEHQHLSAEEVMVIGDSNNDLPLFEMAGLKIAMGNGTEEIKKHADWITDTVDNDGLAVAVEKYILMNTT